MQVVYKDSNSEFDTSGAQCIRSITHHFGIDPLQDGSGPAQRQIEHQGILNSNLNLQ
jgi:hypothetical protein